MCYIHTCGGMKLILFIVVQVAYISSVLYRFYRFQIVLLKALIYFVIKGEKMKSIIKQINSKKIWNDYLDFKRKQSSISKREIEELEDYIEKEKYKKVADEIINGTYVFSIPEKHLINKVNKNKKRVVYNFNNDENMILKVITYLFSKKYDGKYSENCYSFRKKYTVKDALRKLCINKKEQDLYGYKIDVQNYFNSVDVNLLLPILEIFLQDDTELYQFIKNILTEKRVCFNSVIIEEEKGIMAGVPISSFLANIFLQDVDEFFKEENILYARYSDDIIFFTSKDRVNYYMEKLQQKVFEKGLSLNQDKIQFIEPTDKWDFLGFSYQNGVIDISEVAKKKIKGKIKRASRKLRRWMLKNNADSSRAIAAVIRKFNRKFYSIDNKNELTWQLWYFPIINTTKTLHEIDLYMQECLRYIKTGKYNKSNYNLKYKDLKLLGYRPLVSEYYKFNDRKKA